MSVRRYGLYLLYPPGVPLASEGLGRLLVAFLHGASLINDVRFVIVCPSWLVASLREVLLAEHVPLDRIEIHAPPYPPLLLALYTRLIALRSRQRPSRYARFKAWVHHRAKRHSGGMLRAVSRATAGPSAPRFVLPLAAHAAMLAVISPLLLAVSVGRIRRPIAWLRSRRRSINAPTEKLSAAIAAPKNDPLVLRAYRLMEEAEVERLHGIIEGLKDVRAWYCPTAFWPSFNGIDAPKLMCVPDVVVGEFPVAFADLNPRIENNVAQLTSAIRGGQHFVTYSDTIKRTTLGARFSIPDHRVTVIPHAPQDMSPWISPTGMFQSQTAAVQQCHSLLMGALRRSRSPYVAGFANPSVKFLFYASQFRPNKNILTLLRAYEHLLRREFIGHKLILTGKPHAMTGIEEFIAEHHLWHEVLCVTELSTRELAAFYKLADLAVNPSLSEGGFPFTFSEALSVGTPVVMSNIPVTQEVVSDPILQEQMLFDPHDWRDVANRISWAIDNRATLLENQRTLYGQLARRTWGDVVNEHIAVLDRIANQQQPLGAQR